MGNLYGVLKVSADWAELMSSNLNQGYSSIIVSAVLVVALIYLNLKLQKQRFFNADKTGFYVITPGDKSQFIELSETNYNLEFLNKLKTNKKIRLSSNLYRVHLNESKGSYFLEDKNYKNALLINRRRIRKTLLKNGDILDIGELILLYKNSNTEQETSGKNSQDSLPTNTLKWIKPKAPIKKGVPAIVSEATKQEFFLVRSLVFIGSSTMNDLVLKGNDVSLRHAKITKVGNQYKIVDLASQIGTYVNNRRIQQRFLRDGDDISIEGFRFKFRIGKSQSTSGNKNQKDNKKSRNDGGNRQNKNDRADKNKHFDKNINKKEKNDKIKNESVENLENNSNKNQNTNENQAPKGSKKQNEQNNLEPSTNSEKSPNQEN